MCKKKNLSLVLGTNGQICPSGNCLASLGSNSDPWNRFVHPYLTIMSDSHMITGVDAQAGEAALSLCKAQSPNSLICHAVVDIKLYCRVMGMGPKMLTTKVYVITLHGCTSYRPLKILKFQT